MFGISRTLRYVDTKIIRWLGVLRARRLARFLIGFIPTFGVVWFVCNLAYSLMGGTEHYAMIFLLKYAFATFTLLTILSIAYEFCFVHRLFILYNYIIGLCIEHQLRIGFGEWITAARVVSLTVGVLLLFLFVKNNCWRQFVQKQNEVG